MRGQLTVFNEVFTTCTFKRIWRARKEKRKPDENIPSTQRIYIETFNRIIAEGKHGMFLPVKKISSSITIGSLVLLYLILDTFAHSFEVSFDSRIRRSLGFVRLYPCSSSIILRHRPLSNFIQNILT